VFTVINTIKLSSVPYPVRNILQEKNFLLGDRMLKLYSTMISISFGGKYAT